MIVCLIILGARSSVVSGFWAGGFVYRYREFASLTVAGIEPQKMSTKRESTKPLGERRLPPRRQRMTITVSGLLHDRFPVFHTARASKLSLSLRVRFREGFPVLHAHALIVLQRNGEIQL